MKQLQIPRSLSTKYLKIQFPPYIISPYGLFKKSWNILIIFLLIYTAVSKKKKNNNNKKIIFFIYLIACASSEIFIYRG